MKTKEFIERIEELGYHAYVELFRRRIIVETIESEDKVLDVAITRTNNLRATSGIIPDKLFKLACDYAQTPIEEREELKKYYLRATGHADDADFFNYFTDDKSWAIGSKWQEETVQTQFTDQEIKDNPFYEMLKTFEKVEVE